MPNAATNGKAERIERVRRTSSAVRIRPTGIRT
jgi:hypothetical protein